MNDEQYIRRCFELALNGKGRVSPNPMVGAVLVYDGVIIGEGWHQQYGEAHAEVNCIDSVKPEDKHLISSSTMYVSLEPCAHHGNTPPCADRLVKEEVKRVVIANRDPFEKVDGKGVETLKRAGIITNVNLLETEGKWLNRRFFCYHQEKRPYIILKWAQTRDGFIAPITAERFQITNNSSQHLVHKWRAEEDAIMVGYNTAINDDPELTARLWEGHNPLRIVIDKNLSISKKSKLLNKKAKTWLLNASKDSTDEHTKYVKVDFEKDIISQLMIRLFEAKVQSVIIEGGSILLDSFIKQGIWDEARVFTGNKYLKEGIKAPVVNRITPATEQELSEDNLALYINPMSKYPYVKGGEL